MADVRPLSEAASREAAKGLSPTTATTWTRRALLHLHARSIRLYPASTTDGAGQPSDSLYPNACERVFQRHHEQQAQDDDDDDDDDDVTIAAAAKPPTPVTGSSESSSSSSTRPALPPALPAGGLKSRRRRASAPARSFTVIVDPTDITPERSYRLDPSDQLLIGKYVPGAELLPPKTGRDQSKADAEAMQQRTKDGSASDGGDDGDGGDDVRTASRPVGGNSAAATTTRRRVVVAGGGSNGRSVVASGSRRGTGLKPSAHFRNPRPTPQQQAVVPRPLPPVLSPLTAPPATAELANEYVDVPCVASIFDGVPGHPSAATVLFPVAYAPPPKKKDPTRRGTPQLINHITHAPWPAGAPTEADETILRGDGVPPPPGSSAPRTLSWQERVDQGMIAATATCATTASCPRVALYRVKQRNAAAVPLYRVGPGAVAFRVVTQAFESSGAVFTPGGVFDYHCSFAGAGGGPVSVPPSQEGRPPSVGWYTRPQTYPNVSTAASFNVLWAKRADSSVHGCMNPYQRINHFPGSWGIGRKDNLHRNISRLRAATSAADFDIAPRTFLCPAEMSALEADAADFKRRFGSEMEPTYIVKPVASSCGKGIRVVKGIPTGLAVPPPPPPSAGAGAGGSSVGGRRSPAAEAVLESATKVKNYIVQQYLNPFLVDGRKFDLRMYVVMTSVNPLKLFLLDEGLVRFAAERYPGADALLENTWMHLTNYAVNKTAKLRKDTADLDDVEAADDPVDIKWLLSDLRDHFLLTTRDPVPKPTPADMRVATGLAGGRSPTQQQVREAQWARIMANAKDVIVKTVLTIEADVRSQVRMQCRDRSGRGCFELFGFDLMLDANLKPHVIEVNIMPSLATAENVDKAVKGRMLAHLLTLLGVVPYHRPSERDTPTEPLYGDIAQRFATASGGGVRYTRNFLTEEAAAHHKTLQVLLQGAHGTAATAHDNAGKATGDSDEAQVAPSTTKCSGGSRSASIAAVAALDDAAKAKYVAAASTDRLRRAPQGRNVPLLNLASAPLLSQLRAADGASLQHTELPAAPSQPAPSKTTATTTSREAEGVFPAGWAELSAPEMRMIIEAEEELQRAGGFERIYPTPQTHERYSHLFPDGVPRSGYVLASWEAAKQRIAAATGTPPAPTPCVGSGWEGKDGAISSSSSSGAFRRSGSTAKAKRA